MFVGQSCEEPQFDKLGDLGVCVSQLVEGFVQGENIPTNLGCDDFLRVEFLFEMIAAVLLAVSAAGGVHKYPPHGLGGGSEEMSATVLVLGFLDINQPNVRLMH